MKFLVFLKTTTFFALHVNLSQDPYFFVNKLKFILFLIGKNLVQFEMSICPLVTRPNANFVKTNANFFFKHGEQLCPFMCRLSHNNRLGTDLKIEG